MENTRTKTVDEVTRAVAAAVAGASVLGMGITNMREDTEAQAKNPMRTAAEMLGTRPERDPEEPAYGAEGGLMAGVAAMDAPDRSALEMPGIDPEPEMPEMNGPEDSGPDIGM